MRVDVDLIKRVGSVMKLEFTKEDIEQFVEETEETIDMLDKLSDLDTDGIEPTFYGGPDCEARFRDDEAIQDEKEVEALLENAPSTHGQSIEVPAILDDGEGGA